MQRARDFFLTLVLLAAVVLAAVLLAAPPAWADEEQLDVTPAIAAAQEWLGLVDAGRYGDAWERTAPPFQAAMSKHRFETSLPAVRDPLGHPVSRKMRQATVARAKPEGPAGDFVVITFDSRFETRPLTVEVVTPMRVGDRWLVSDYTIR